MARIFLAGASGAIGRPLTRMLVAAGHNVTGTLEAFRQSRPVGVDVTIIQQPQPGKVLTRAGPAVTQ